MARIQVELDEGEIRAACEYWAVNRVLNEGRALSSEMQWDLCQEDRDVRLSGCTVWVETDRNKGT